MRVRLDVTRASEAAAADRPAGGARPARGAERSAETTGRTVAPRRTQLSPAEIRSALARAHEKLHGSSIAPQQLDVLAAQVAHETGYGASMHNFNFGGIKGTSPEGLTARCRTKEVLGGEVKSIVDGFRAYGSAEAGATDYLAFVERKYPAAWAAAKRGDVNGFVHALKARGYFTADEAGYAAAVRGVLARGFDAGGAASSAPSPLAPLGAPGNAGPADLPEGPTTIALARVLDAVAASSARIAGPLTDESGEDA